MVKIEKLGPWSDHVSEFMVKISSRSHHERFIFERYDRLQIEGDEGPMMTTFFVASPTVVFGVMDKIKGEGSPCA